MVYICKIYIAKGLFITFISLYSEATEINQKEDYISTAKKVSNKIYIAI